jgi:hypothetical protein
MVNHTMCIIVTLYPNLCHVLDLTQPGAPMKMEACRAGCGLPIRVPADVFSRRIKFRIDA